MKKLLLVFSICCGTAYGQDAGAMAAQQAMQDMQNATTAAQLSMQLSQPDNLMMTRNANVYAGFPYNIGGVLSLPVAPGIVKPGTKVPINFSRDRYAQIYYTTDGWTPTTESTRYRSPLRINATTRLQAMALEPDSGRRMYISANYEIAGGVTEPGALVVEGGVLRAGTAIRLATGAEISSQTAHVGDSATIVLDEDVKVGDRVVAAKGTAVEAVLTGVSPADGVAAGKLVFAVRGMNAYGVVIPLSGSETLEGRGGKAAVIEPGMGLTATVAGDVVLAP